jgi:sporulation protein YlmC with PRC-barrel domain
MQTTESRPESRPESCSETSPESRLEPRPWWAYFVYAGSDVLGRVLSARIAEDGKEDNKQALGVNVSQSGELKPGIDPERITATTIIGERVMGSDGKELGKITEVALDLTTGFISYFVLSVGGILGFGDKFYALPLPSLTLKPEERTFYIDINKKKLKQMPEFDKHNWPKKAEWTVTP